MYALTVVCKLLLFYREMANVCFFYYLYRWINFAKPLMRIKAVIFIMVY